MRDSEMEASLRRTRKCCTTRGRMTMGTARSMARFWGTGRVMPRKHPGMCTGCCPLGFGLHKEDLPKLDGGPRSLELLDLLLCTPF